MILNSLLCVGDEYSKKFTEFFGLKREGYVLKEIIPIWMYERTENVRNRNHINNFRLYKNYVRLGEFETFLPPENIPIKNNLLEKLVELITFIESKCKDSFKEKLSTLSKKLKKQIINQERPRKHELCIELRFGPANKPFQ